MRCAEIEEGFIRTFIAPERRERYILLLANPRRRRQFLDRLNHGLDFIPSLARQVPDSQHSHDGVARLLNERGIQDTEEVYILSADGTLDTQRLPMRLALELVLIVDSGSVVCDPSRRLAYYRPEAPASGYIIESASSGQDERRDRR